MRLLTPFIDWRREGRRYRGGETVDDEWCYLMSFQGEERNGKHPFENGKGACEVALGSHLEGH
jgi:hypothetical protein